VSNHGQAQLPVSSVKPGEKEDVGSTSTTGTGWDGFDVVQIIVSAIAGAGIGIIMHHLTGNIGYAFMIGTVSTGVILRILEGIRPKAV
jgi:hypothetical protein